MKKIALAFILILSGAFTFAQEKLFNWDLALATGIPIHSSTMDAPKSEILITPSFKRIILGLNGDVVINITEPVKLIAGADCFCEFLWDGSDHYNSLDYSFFGGVKVFPNLGGFNFSIAYVFGSKTTFYKTEEIKDTNKSSAWGNGFRIAFEYVFLYGGDSTIFPIVGASYKFMPRGQYTYDHIISAYAGIRL